MVEVAREKLRDRAAPADLRPGNLLERKSYSFEGLSGGFDLVFTYDVVQQLPRAAQAATCRRMVAALAPGGVAVIFDNEADSRFGRRIALRKLVTRYSGLPPVPRYYRNPASPPLAPLHKQTAESATMGSESVLLPDGVQRALDVENQ